MTEILKTSQGYQMEALPAPRDRNIFSKTHFYTDNGKSSVDCRARAIRLICLEWALSAIRRY
jgi:hypothetical protein